MGDLPQAFRSLRKHPAFALVAVATLAFGIGVNVSLFSLVSAFFLQPLPVRNADELILVLQRGEAINLPYGQSYPDYLDFRRAVTSLSGLAAYMPMPAHLSVPGGKPERTWIEAVSPNYFDVAGISPALGEFPRTARDERTGAAPTVVLSYRYWQRRFGGDRSLVGRPITINGRSFTVLGIAPDRFTGLSWAMAPSAFVSSGGMGALQDDGDAFRDSRGAPAWRLIGRLAPGRTFADARGELEVIAKRLAADYPLEHKGTRVLVIPENRARPDPAVADFLPVFAAVFAGMVALVLLIACANVASLILSRAVLRQRDLVIRAALGASRFRLMRLQIVESLVLAAVAGVLGAVLAHWSGELLVTLVPTGGDIPVVDERAIDWRVYVFTFLISAVAGIATGVWPARQATRFDLVQGLKDGGTVAGGSRHLLRNLLVIGQVTMSVIVLATAALFLHSLRQMQNLALGFTPDRLVMVSVDLALQQYSDERGRRFLEDLLVRAEALPGVESATLMNHVPFDYGIQLTDVATAEEIPGSTDGYVSSAFNVVGPGFFETTGATLIRGRLFERSDTRESRRVAVVNETMAGKLWPGEDPIGKRFRFGRNGPWTEIVGLAADGKYVMLGEEPRTYFYLPMTQEYRSPMTLMVRSAAGPAATMASLERLVGERDPDLPVFNVRTMDEHLRDSVFGLMPLRTGTAIATLQGLIALLLAVMGLYAVVAQAVARRIREIGVRMALGARPADIMRLVLREGMSLSAAGIALGLPVALGLGFGLSRVLYGLAPVDVGVLAGVTLLLVLVTGLACYVPARRATHVDPLIALRYE